MGHMYVVFDRGRNGNYRNDVDIKGAESLKSFFSFLAAFALSPLLRHIRRGRGHYESAKIDYGSAFAGFVNCPSKGVMIHFQIVA